jgi:hypothetical protein
MRVRDDAFTHSLLTMLEKYKKDVLRSDGEKSEKSRIWAEVLADRNSRDIDFPALSSNQPKATDALDSKYEDVKRVQWQNAPHEPLGYPTTELRVEHPFNPAFDVMVFQKPTDVSKGKSMFAVGNTFGPFYTRECSTNNTPTGKEIRWSPRDGQDLYKLHILELGARVGHSISHKQFAAPLKIGTSWKDYMILFRQAFDKLHPKDQEPVEHIDTFELRHYTHTDICLFNSAKYDRTWLMIVPRVHNEGKDGANTPAEEFVTFNYLGTSADPGTIKRISASQEESPEVLETSADPGTIQRISASQEELPKELKESIAPRAMYSTPPRAAYFPACMLPVMQIE